MPRGVTAYLEDIENGCRDIAGYIEGYDLMGHLADSRTRAAVERKIEIVGEALRQMRDLSPSAYAAVPDATKVVGMRNVIAHGYAVLDQLIVWDAASTRIPALRRSCAAMAPDGGAGLA